MRAGQLICLQLKTMRMLFSRTTSRKRGFIERSETHVNPTPVQTIDLVCHFDLISIAKKPSPYDVNWTTTFALSIPPGSKSILIAVDK